MSADLQAINTHMWSVLLWGKCLQHLPAAACRFQEVDVESADNVLHQNPKALPALKAFTIQLAIKFSTK